MLSGCCGPDKYELFPDADIFREVKPQPYRFGLAIADPHYLESLYCGPVNDILREISRDSIAWQVDLGLQQLLYLCYC